MMMMIDGADALYSYRKRFWSHLIDVFFNVGQRSVVGDWFNTEAVPYLQLVCVEHR